MAGTAYPRLTTDFGTIASRDPPSLSSAATCVAPRPGTGETTVQQLELVEQARRGDHDAFTALAGAAAHGSMRWLASSSATRNAARTPPRRRSCAPGATCPRSATPTLRRVAAAPPRQCLHRRGAQEPRHTSRSSSHRSTTRRSGTAPSRRRARCARARLPAPRHGARALIVLHHYLGLSLPEVAETMRIPVGPRSRACIAPCRRCAPRSRPTRGSPPRLRGPISHEHARRLHAAPRRLARGRGRPTTPDYLDDVFERTRRPAATGLAQPREVAAQWTTTHQPARLLAAARVAKYALTAALLLIVAVAALVLFAGPGAHRVPPPFGPAANGRIYFDVNGAIVTTNSDGSGGRRSTSASPRRQPRT